jgi:hypothetical protein
MGEYAEHAATAKQQLQLHQLIPTGMAQVPTELAQETGVQPIPDAEKVGHWSVHCSEDLMCCCGCCYHQPQQHQQQQQWCTSVAPWLGWQMHLKDSF